METAHMMESVLNGPLRRARREAGELLDEAKPLLRRFGGKVSDADRARLLALRDSLVQARKGRDGEKIANLTNELDDELDKLLGEFRKSPTRLWVESMLRAVLVVVAIRVLIIEPFMIPSGSMIPTLQIGDHIFVTKFLYGIRVPFINYQLWQASTPHRGDVIVFNHPLDPSKDLIKRVVGLPGDVVTTDDETVKVNGVPQPRTLLNADYRYWNYRPSDESLDDRGHWYETKHIEEYEERLQEDGDVFKAHIALQNPGGRPRPPEGPFVVPADSVFVMGDNRDDSADGRVGPPGGWYVPYGNIKGKAMFVWLSLGKGGWWFCHGSSFLCTDGGIRFDRFGHVIH